MTEVVFSITPELYGETVLLKETRSKQIV